MRDLVATSAASEKVGGIGLEARAHGALRVVHAG